jgi:hypothetical protein
VDVQTNNKPPEFLEPVQDITILSTDLLYGDLAYELPYVIDRDGSKVTGIMVELGATHAFMSFDPD